MGLPLESAGLKLAPFAEMLALEQMKEGEAMPAAAAYIEEGVPMMPWWSPWLLRIRTITANQISLLDIFGPSQTEVGIPGVGDEAPSLLDVSVLGRGVGASSSSANKGWSSRGVEGGERRLKRRDKGSVP